MKNSTESSNLSPSSATEEELIFNPYNHNNVQITEHDIVTILKRYGLPPRITNFELWRRAFIHRSYTKRPEAENEANEITIAPKPPGCLPLSTKSNERLEFLGDGVLECITKYYLYRRFPKEDEGFMTEKKIALVKNESIGKLAYEMGLNKWYIISQNAEEKKTRTNLKKLGCLFESFLGALFLDFNKISIHDDDKWFDNVFVTGPGFQIAQIFVENIFEKHVNWMELIKNDDNYKNILQVMLQKAFQVTPVYREVSEWDEELGYHMGVYLCINIKSHEFEPTDDCVLKIEFFKNNTKPLDNIKELLIDNPEKKMVIFLSEDKHKIKKKAEQSACKMAIDKLN